MLFPDIERPTLLLDERKCRANIRRMAEKARRSGVRLRPHFKTHQSAMVGKWFREAGVTAATVSSLSMAKYFADHGWTDLTVAFPFNPREIALADELAGRVSLNLLVVHPETVAFLERELSHPAAVYLKVDVGTRRTGVRPEDDSALEALRHSLLNARKLRFRGFLAHAGHSYACRNRHCLEKVWNETATLLQNLRSRWAEDFPMVEISVGDTPTCSAVTSFQGVDEVRPGNFVFYDLMQWQIGACSFEDIAVALACPVVARHPERLEIILYGGGGHLSKDRLEHPAYGTIYGLPVKLNEEGWSEPLPGCYLRSLSQEHGVLRCTSEAFDQWQIGDLVGILPVHSCMCADSMKGYRVGGA